MGSPSGGIELPDVEESSPSVLESRSRSGLMGGAFVKTVEILVRSQQGNLKRPMTQTITAQQGDVDG
jgi:hypothetical protein